MPPSWRRKSKRFARSLFLLERSPMLRFVFVCGLAALLLAGTTPVRAADKALPKNTGGDVKSIIATAIEAKGGESNVEKYKASISKFKGKFHGQGLEADMTGSQTLAPGKQRIEAALDAGGTAISYLAIVDGDKGWISVNGNPEEMSKDQL